MAAAHRVARRRPGMATGARDCVPARSRGRAPIRVGSRWPLVVGWARGSRSERVPGFRDRGDRTLDSARVEDRPGRDRTGTGVAAVRPHRCGGCQPSCVPGVAWTPQVDGRACRAGCQAERHPWARSPAMTTVRLFTTFPAQRAQSGPRRVLSLNFSGGSGSIQGFSAPRPHVLPGPISLRHRGRA
jgi:hypothetical protein